jgi:hypothetical protein
MMAFPAHHGSYATTRVAKRDVAQFAVVGPVSEPRPASRSSRWQVPERSRTQNVSHLDSQPSPARPLLIEGVNFDRFMDPQPVGYVTVGRERGSSAWFAHAIRLGP